MRASELGKEIEELKLNEINLKNLLNKSKEENKMLKNVHEYNLYQVTLDTKM